MRNEANICGAHNPILVHKSNATGAQILQVNQLENKIPLRKELVGCVILGYESFGIIWVVVYDSS